MASLDTFQRWVEKTTFFPRPKMSLRVEDSTGSLLKSQSKGVCVECRDRWATSKILEVMEMINWMNVENLDLSIIVKVTG